MAASLERDFGLSADAPTNLEVQPPECGGVQDLGQLTRMVRRGDCIDRPQDGIVVRRSGGSHRRQFGAAESAVTLMALVSAWRSAEGSVRDQGLIRQWSRMGSLLSCSGVNNRRRKRQLATYVRSRTPTRRNGSSALNYRQIVPNTRRA